MRPETQSGISGFIETCSLAASGEHGESCHSPFSTATIP
jgi:hypothetical protein